MRLLAIVHQPDAGLGVFADAIAAGGAQVDAWAPPDEPAPPGDIGEYDAVIVLGGEVHPDQVVKHPWLRKEKRLLEQLIRTRKPVLAVCLGAQLLAEAAGGAAGRSPHAEIGWYETRTTDEAAADPLIGELAPRFDALEWHSYEFSLPPGAVALAHTDSCLQAFRVGDAAWAIQFHAEVTATDLESWIDEYRGDPQALRPGTPAEMDAWNELGRGLCRRFLEAVARTQL